MYTDMTIRYANGTVVEGILLRRTESSMRVAVPGGEDTLEFTRIHQVWVSEDCEPVRIEFNWQRHRAEDTFSEANFICPHELAAHLLHVLWTDSSEDVGTSEQMTPDAGLASVLARRLMLN